MIGELTNHVWQSTLFAAAAALLSLAFRKNQARVRYWLWLCASLKFFVPFSVLMSLGSRLDWAQPAAHKTATQAVAVTMLQVSLPFPSVVRAAHADASSSINWAWVAFAVWLCGLLAVAMTRARVWLRIREALRRSSPTDIPAAIPVRSSPGLLEPGVVGLLHPVLLLPANIAERLTGPQLQAVISHEIWHVRRRDNLYATIHMLAEAVFWFHPLVWWIGARLVEEREQACDEGVLTLGSAPQVYAEAIVNVCKLYVESPLVCVSGVTGADLKLRIEAIMANRMGQRLNRAKKLLLAGAGAAALAGPLLIGIGNAPVIRAQSQRGPSFEVATIKPTDPQFQGSVVQAPANDSKLSLSGFTLKGLIQFAYGAHEDLITGAPGWASADRYDVLGRPEGTRIPPADERKEMLKTLLADRFHLQFHREPKLVTAYVLTVGKGPLKLKKHEPQDDGAQMSLFFRGPSVPAKDVSLDRLAATLQSIVLDRPVLNKTGLTGTWDFDLAWTPDESQFSGRGARMREANPDGPSLNEALEQLGLKLETQKAPIDAIVIDHVEKPTAN